MALQKFVGKGLCCKNNATISLILWGHVSIWYACGELCVAMQGRYLENLDFTFCIYTKWGKCTGKGVKKEIPVSVGIELVAMDMLRNGKFMGKITFLTVKAERVFYFIGNFLNRQK